MTRTEIEDLLERHRAAFARHDPGELADQHAVTGTFESPAVGLVRGREKIYDVYRYWLTAFPDMEFTWPDAAIDVDRAMFFWNFAGTTDGPFFGLERPGLRVTMIGAADYRFAEGRILSARHVFDFSGVLIKVGVLKARPP
jgi:predicted ester cyclase